MKYIFSTLIFSMTLLLGCNLVIKNQDSTIESAKIDESNPDGKDSTKIETSTNGVITKETPEEIDQNENQTTVLAKYGRVPWIGAVPAADPARAQCPEGMISIYMDDEDHSNRNLFRLNGVYWNGFNYSIGGLSHPASPRRAGGNTLIHFCPKQVNTLPRLSYDYAVISASGVCPENSHRFYKRWDNEDSGNNNHHTGLIYPHVNVNSYTKMYFCFVPKAKNRTRWSTIFNGTMIFTNSRLRNYGYMYQDDEDSRNNNGYWSSKSAYTARMQSIITAGSNTKMHFGSNSAVTTVNLGDDKGCTSPTVAYAHKCTRLGGKIKCETVVGKALETLKSVGEYFDCWW